MLLACLLLPHATRKAWDFFSSFPSQGLRARAAKAEAEAAAARGMGQETGGGGETHINENKTKKGVARGDGMGCPVRFGGFFFSLLSL